MSGAPLVPQSQHLYRILKFYVTHLSKYATVEFFLNKKDASANLYLPCCCMVMSNKPHTSHGQKNIYKYCIKYFMRWQLHTKCQKLWEITGKKKHNWHLCYWKLGHKGPVLRLRCSRSGRDRTQIPFNSIKIQQIT